MSSVASPEQSSASRANTKSQRVLACVLCQQRKVKCDRRFPCANCVRASAQCVPATLLPRRRRKKLPEAEQILLDRVHHYEALLKRHQIAFEPLSSSNGPPQKPLPDDSNASSDPMDATSPSINHEHVSLDRQANQYEDFRGAMKRWFKDPDDSEGSEFSAAHVNDLGSTHDDPHLGVLKQYWKQRGLTSNQLIFGFQQSDLDLASLHPNQVQIFKLWQIYLDNVNPLLKVTHTPTLQTRIIDAAGNVCAIKPSLEALMFSIYCVAILSLTDEQCQTQFGSSSQELLRGYQMGCQQALVQSEFLSTEDRDCLVALYFYLLSMRHDADARSVASMLGVAVRISERLGIHDEGLNSKCNVVEAELRRRLWWSLINFDSRICEIAGHKSSALALGWNCAFPLNVNDFDMREDMQVAPEAHKTPTEALFVVLRTRVSDMLRRIRSQSNADGSSSRFADFDIEKELEEKYFRFCNLENPLHFVSLWSTRNILAKTRLMMNYSAKGGTDSADPTERDAAFADALIMMESDTQLMGSPLTKGFHWFINSYFPFPAFVHLVHDLKERPIGEHADRAWNLMSENFKARSKHMSHVGGTLIKVFARRISQAWEIREAALAASSGSAPFQVPVIVSGLQQMLQHKVRDEASPASQFGDTSTFPATSTMDFTLNNPVQMTDMGGSFTPEDLGVFPDPFALPTMDMGVNMGFHELNVMRWNQMQARGWW